MFCRPFEVWQPLTQTVAPKVGCLLCSWPACLLIFHFPQLSGILAQKQPTGLQKLFFMSKNSCKDYFVEWKQINSTTATNFKLQMFGAKTCHSCTQLEQVFFLMLACMAGVKRGRGRGDFGATPNFPLPLLTPTRQAPLTSTDIDATNVIYFWHYLCVSPFMANVPC